ncbi:L-seryl-tRNA(Sec) selenium transferase [Bradyrhizobium canariense]|uniref:L-seryl-tRNA(Sec) selenium transferase n=1 Tax=Bradyrhizobium canariense TaxID=255045 RepID=A0A1H2B9G4_9BRAD|nr:L-seryl-tRNA(Sec) selenium transferase [Bradyrhizobium canariense]SDT54853.1 L-seryl-tRNA(Sec) selenium transferase [Bradyrhizobium canariense]
MSAWDKSSYGQDETQSARLRALPSVTAILSTAAAAELTQRFGRMISTEAVRITVDDARTAIKAGAPAPGADDLALQALARLEERDRSGLRPLFNLTGTILHTNLGRAVLAESAIEAATAAMRDAVALEFDLSTGKRGERDDHLRALLCDLTGAEDATVVNNNAAAVLLCLNTLAQGQEAIISRGELIEIGGAFRMPDIMARAGTKMIEVGTTNRTHPRDYRAALSAQTGVILKVHTSNYRIQGFTAEVSAAELASIAGEKGVPLLNDLGSGTLIDLAQFGLQKEPTVRDAVAQGAGLVTFSGDKLLGGPQAGFIVGSKVLIAQVNRNPMKRALRVDKIRLAAIEATLKLYRDPDRLADRLPTLRLLARSRAEIEVQANRLRPLVAKSLGESCAVDVCACESQIGSGALPLDTIASAGLMIRTKNGSGALDRLAAALRGLRRPVIGRIADGGLTLDLRCLADEDEFVFVLSELNVDALTG